jgi:hypothetical protein
MQTTIIIRDENVEIFYADGTHSHFLGRQPTEKEAVAAIKKVIRDTNLGRAINDIVNKAEMEKGLRRLKSSLKPLRAKK